MSMPTDVSFETQLKHLHNRQDRSRFWAFMIVFAITVALYFVSAKSVYSRNYAESDFIAFWNSATIVASGGDPYDPVEWEKGIFASGATIKYDDTFLYPVTLAVLLSPLFGHLPLHWGFVIWNWLSSLFIIASTLIVLSIYTRKGVDVKHYLLPLLLSAIVFRPVIHMMWSGQLVGWLMLICAIVIYLWEGEKWWEGGAVLALLSLKPGIGVPMIALLAVYLIWNRKYSALIGTACSGLVLIAVGLLYDSHWIEKFLWIGSAKVSPIFGRAATFWGTAGLLCSNTSPCTLVLGALAACAITGATLFVILKHKDASPLVVVSGIVGASILISPYLWDYDQTLLIFPIIVCMFAIKDRAPYLVSALLFLAVDILALISLALATSIEHDGWTALPSIAVVILWLVLAGRIQATHRSYSHSMGLTEFSSSGR